MIRFLIGFLILAGVAGTDDYALASGTQPLPLWEVVVFSLLGLTIMVSGLSKILEENEKNG
jgi:hypothetical protein